MRSSGPCCQTEQTAIYRARSMISTVPVGAPCAPSSPTTARRGRSAGSSRRCDRPRPARRARSDPAHRRSRGRGSACSRPTPPGRARAPARAPRGSPRRAARSRRPNGRCRPSRSRSARPATSSRRSWSPASPCLARPARPARDLLLALGERARTVVARARRASASLSDARRLARGAGGGAGAGATGAEMLIFPCALSPPAPPPVRPIAPIAFIGAADARRRRRLGDREVRHALGHRQRLAHVLALAARVHHLRIDRRRTT